MTFSRFSVALLCAAALGACGDDDGAGDEGACAPVKTIAKAVEVYGEAWNERDPARRDCLLARSVSPELVYVDPTIDTTTADALSTAIAAFQTSAPGASIVQLSGLDLRGRELRFAWDFRVTDAATGVEQSAVKGVDYMQFSGDARITHIRGYWDPLPPGPPEGALSDYVAAWQASLDEPSRTTLLVRVLDEDARFTSADDNAHGLSEIGEVINSRAAEQIEVSGVQRYAKFARVALELTSGAVVQNVTDYLYLDTEGRITRIARFDGDLPPL
jgi:hypothetical protein